MTTQARPWTAFYGPDAPAEIETATYRTVGDLIGSVAETYG